MGGSGRRTLRRGIGDPDVGEGQLVGHRGLATRTPAGRAPCHERTERLDAAGIPYMLTGSMAASYLTRLVARLGLDMLYREVAG